MSHAPVPPEVPNIDELIDPASVYIFREATAAEYERAEAERLQNFGIADALMAGLSLQPVWLI